MRAEQLLGLMVSIRFRTYAVLGCRAKPLPGCGVSPPSNTHGVGGHPSLRQSRASGLPAGLGDIPPSSPSPSLEGKGPRGWSKSIAGPPGVPSRKYVDSGGGVAPPPDCHAPIASGLAMTMTHAMNFGDPTLDCSRDIRMRQRGHWNAQ
jgi:hypothetical protein